MKTLLVAILIVAAVLTVFYLLLIMPRMIHKPDPKPYLNVLYAHRGLHNNETQAPENSLAAFQKAVDAGYGIELDVQLSRDKVPVVFHDFTLKRMCGVEGKVEDYTYEQLQQFQLAQSSQRIPRFEEVLKLVDGRVPLIVELKIERFSTEVCPLVDQLLHDYPGVYCIESFNPLGLKWYRDHRPEVFRGQLSEQFLKSKNLRKPLYFLLQNLLFNFISKPDFIAYNHRHANALSLRICHRMYHNVAAAWTIKSQAELDAARKEFDIFIFDSFIPASHPAC